MPRKEKIFREIFRKQLSPKRRSIRTNKVEKNETKAYIVRYNIFLCECGVGFVEKGKMCGFCGIVMQPK